MIFVIVLSGIFVIEVANNTKREMAKAMLADGDSIAKVSRISGLSEDEIQAL